MPRSFNPAAHPRDKFGRFTKSRTVKASTKDKKAAREVADRFQPKQVPRVERGAYLKQIAGPSGGVGDLADVNKALRAGKASPEADRIDQAMIALPDDVLLSRRVPASAFGSTDPVSLQGMKVRDAGFAASQLGTVPAGAGQVRMHIAAPAGTRAVVDPDTGEVVLDKDTELVVAKVAENSAGGHDMWLTVLPKTDAAASKSDSTGGGKGDEKPAPVKPQPAEPVDGTDQVRADLMKLKVPELQAQMRERGLKPGRLRKSQLVDALVADETGSEATPPATPTGKSPGSFADRVAAAVTGEEALTSTPFSLIRTETHARFGNRRGLSVASRDALSDYQDASYQQINKALRDTDPPQGNVPPGLDPKVGEWVAEIDTAMAGSALPSDTVVYRGVRNIDRMFGDRLGQDMTGYAWRESAYMSTSVDPKVVDPFMSKRTGGVRMRILAPTGTRAVQLSAFVDGAGHPDEAELLLDRGYTLRVAADRGVAPDGTRDLDVEIVTADGDGRG